MPDLKKIGLGETVLSRSESETRRLGEAIGKMLAGGGVAGLTGDLGAGKTVIASGIFRGAGLAPDVAVTSPTFTLVNVYPGPVEMYHVDLYRLRTGREAVHAGITELWDEGGGLVVVEWFEKFPELWPEVYLKVEIEIAGKRERRIRARRCGRNP